MDNKNLLYCILGSVILIFFNTRIIHDALHFFPIIGLLLSRVAYLISIIGILLTLYFSILLIKENWLFNKK